MRRFRDLSGEVLFFNESVFTFEIKRGELIDYCITGRNFYPTSLDFVKVRKMQLCFLG